MTTPEPDGLGPPYEVHGSGVIAAEIRRLRRQAAGEGRSAAMMAALREIHRRLQLDPNALGEPLYRLPVLRMQVRTCVVRPLAVDFAVCEDRPVVIIKGVSLLTDPQT
jgi:hypothetical protein